MPSTSSRYCKRLVQKALQGFRDHNTNHAAGRAAGVDEATIRYWRKRHPEFEAQVQDAIEHFCQTAGHETAEALIDHVRAAHRGDMVVTKRGTEGGKEVHIEERVMLNPGLARMILTRADPRYTHPKQQVEHSGGLTIEESVKQAAERLEETNGDE